LTSFLTRGNPGRATRGGKPVAQAAFDAPPRFGVPPSGGWVLANPRNLGIHHTLEETNLLPPASGKKEKRKNIAKSRK